MNLRLGPLSSPYAAGRDLRNLTDFNHPDLLQ